jgi:hypothetical protein
MDPCFLQLECNYQCLSGTWTLFLNECTEGCGCASDPTGECGSCTGEIEGNYCANVACVSGGVPPPTTTAGPTSTTTLLDCTTIVGCRYQCSNGVFGRQWYFYSNFGCVNEEGCNCESPHNLNPLGTCGTCTEARDGEFCDEGTCINA